MSLFTSPSLAREQKGQKGTNYRLGLDLSVRGFSLFLFARLEVEEFFNSMDRDFDGRLSFEEFMGEESQIGKN